MADSFTLADLATFEKDFKPAASKAPDPQPAGQQPAGATDQTAADSATSENQPADSPAADTAQGDANVDDSSAADTTTADASDDSDPADLTSETADQQPAKGKGRAQARIEDLVASNKALKASLDYMQNQVLAKLPQPQQQSQVGVPSAGAQPVAANEAAPTLESCGYDTDKWTQAMHAWTDKRIEQGVTKAVRTVHQEQTIAARAQSFASREAAFAATAPDYGVVIGNPALPKLAPDPASLVLDSELGPQILYHLGKDPAKAARIARMTPVQQAAAIGRIEAEIQTAAKSSTQRKTSTTNITRAPNPPTPTAGRGNTPSVDPSKLSAKEWIEWDRKQTEAKQRARKSG